PFLLIDVINQEHIRRAGEILLRYSRPDNQLLVGSSGIEAALTASLQERSLLSASELQIEVPQATKLVVMAGSCSPITRNQIEWALQNGFEGIRINSPGLIGPGTREQEIQRVVAAVCAVLPQKNVVIFTALGPDDQAIADTRTKMTELTGNSFFPADYLARIQGEILRRILEVHADARVTVAGGDTSGYVAQALEIYALEVLVPVAPGAPLCIAHSKNKKFDGLEIALKGGQCGKDDYFESIYLGTTPRAQTEPALVSIV
ncbi:MAG: hypothetical protein KKG00_10155, partial [Bacteroidetes bacterium]|nr:hypothetical protein [Bacteroidota bacterium]